MNSIIWTVAIAIVLSSLGMALAGLDAKSSRAHNSQPVCFKV